MHILTLTPFDPAADDDASGCFVAESVGELERQGIESSVIAVQPKHRPHPLAGAKSPAATWKNYFCLPGNAGLSTAGHFLYATLKAQVRQLHRLKPVRLIHAHAALPCGQAAMLLARDLGIPFVVSVHGLDVFSTRQVSGWLGRRCANVSEDVYRTATRVVCISDQVARRVRAGIGDANNIVVVYNGVDTSLFSPALSSEFAAEESPILSVGNLIPIKGHDLLLKSMAVISADHPQVHCKVIGDGPERARLQQLARDLRIADRVKFLGRRPRSEVAVAMRQCALFALPSWYEGLGCVYLEAMSAGRPAIGCHGQGIEEIIRHGENGWLVEPENFADLTLAIRTLLSNGPLRDSIGHEARQTILRGYTLEHQAKQLISIYQESLR